MIETVLGAVVLVVAGFFLIFAYRSADLRKVEGYPLTAQFTNIGGLQVGNDVRISGVKVGSVTAQWLDPLKFLATVQLTLDPSIKLPRDTVALISSESLLGGKFLALEPGGDPDLIAAGGRIEYTQSNPGFEQLLGQVIYSLQSIGKPNADGGGSGSAPAPAAAAASGTPAAKPRK